MILHLIIYRSKHDPSVYRGGETMKFVLSNPRFFHPKAQTLLLTLIQNSRALHSSTSSDSRKPICRWITLWALGMSPGISYTRQYWNLAECCRISNNLLLCW